MNDDDLLNPLKGLQRAEPGPFLFTRLEARIGSRAATHLALRVSPATARLALAGLFLLGVLNAWVWRQAPEPVNPEPAIVYRMETASYQLY